MSKALGLILFTFILTQNPGAGNWRDISPLRSTRADVERLLGSPGQGSDGVYQTAGERILVTYAVRPCDYGWQVPAGTVISLSVTPKNPPALAAFKLDERKFEKRRDAHVESLYYYVDQEDGVNYTVDTAKGVVMNIEHYPAAKDNQRRCSTAKDSAAATAERARTAERVREMERLAPAYEYTCLMHPEVRQAQGGTCPKCGMMLTTVKPSVLGEYKLSLATQPLRPKAGEKTRLRFVISDPRTGAPVRDYVLSHEKLFHLFIVSRDMREYQHVHPRLGRDGSFTVETVLPRAGVYQVHADFFPAGGTPQVLHREIITAGHRAAGTASHASLTPDATLVKSVGGVKISLRIGGGGAPVAGALVPLIYRLEDERTGEPVRDLQPYLGAWGHTLILNADQSEYLHSHPREMLPDNVDRATLRGGPEVEFQTMFPAPGDYRIWTQFQRAGRVITVFFTVRVAA